MGFANPHQTSSSSPDSVFFFFPLGPLLQLKPFFKSASFVACPVLSYLVRYVDALAHPSLAFRLNHLLHYHHVMPKMKQMSCNITQIKNLRL
jgi:hypothetical protein